MIRSRFVALAGWLACTTVGCTSTGVGNPGVSSLQLSIVSDNADNVAAGLEPSDAGDAGGMGSDAGLADAAAGTPSDAGDAAASDAGAAGATSDPSLPQGAIAHAIIVLGELSFQPCDASVGTVFTVPGPFVVDLKEKTTTPELPVIEGTPSGYCGIDAPLAPASSPAALAGKSVFFDGYRADGTFFLVYANMIGTLRLRATPGTTWQGTSKPPLFFWALRPRRWLAPSELDSAEVTAYDTHQRAIVIDIDRHPALYLAIRMRLAGVSTLYADANGNGVFDDADRRAVVGLGDGNAD